MTSSKNLLRFVLIIVLMWGSQRLLIAEDGNPIAVRSWPEGVISIETQWGLTIAVADDNPAAEKIANDLPDHADQFLVYSQNIDHRLIRKPNDDTPNWQPLTDRDETEPNAIYVQSIIVKNAKVNPLQIAVDNLRILAVPMESVAELVKKMEIEKTAKADKNVEVDLKKIDLLMLSGAVDDFQNESTLPAIVSLLSAVNPKATLLNATGSLSESSFKKIASSLNPHSKISWVDHNTFAISAFTASEEHPNIVSLKDTPWKMPADLELLFAAMEKSSQESQAIFRKLSIDQINFEPSNGTHTPRWNTEHMMGRQLLFFSQMYQTVDPAIQAIDLNPAQMPPEYTFAHPDWTGAEEARQIKRVGDFCRRFAYLLDGIGVEQKAPGTFWPSLKALLEQMDRHYHEHTENTIKKFELPDWPKK